MSPRVKESLEWLTEPAKIACYSALGTIALYALLFMDVGGGGRLWDAISAALAPEQQSAPVAVRSYIVPVRPIDRDKDKREQDRMLMLPSVADKEMSIPVEAAPVFTPQPSASPAAAASAAAPAKDWRVHIQGGMSPVTVYGRGEQRGSASTWIRASTSQTTQSAAAVASVRSAPTPARAGSAYQTGTATAEAVARPGVSDHVTPVGVAADDSVRNFR